MEKFKYQVVIDVDFNECEKIIFVGETELDINTLLSDIDLSLKMYSKYSIVSVFYEPIKANENGKKET